jgi:hypothetical protein
MQDGSLGLSLSSPVPISLASGKQPKWHAISVEERQIVEFLCSNACINGAFLIIDALRAISVSRPDEALKLGAQRKRGPENRAPQAGMKSHPDGIRFEGLRPW